MRTHLLALLTVGCLLDAAVGFADPAPPTPVADLQCKFRHDIVEVGGIEEMPRPILNTLLAHMDPAAREDAKFEWHNVMAPRGGIFNSTDVVMGDYPTRRFIRAGHEGTEWFLWYEHGGIAYTKNIALFHLRLGRGVPVVRSFVSYRQENPCGLTDDLMDNRPSPGGQPSGW